jgi:hypothetical protein
MLHQRSSRISHQKVVLHRALARLDKIHSASSISRAASTSSSFGIPKPTVRGSLAFFGWPTFVGIGNCSGASFVRRPNPNPYGITASSLADPDFRRQGVRHSFMETSHVVLSERSPLRIVITENELEGARTEGSGDGEMKYRRATIVADDWHGEFGSYDEWARLGPQPPYRTATFLMLMGDVALLTVTLPGHGTIGHFQ